MTPAQQVRWEHYVDLLRVDLENMEEGGDLLGEESWLKVVLSVNAELAANRAIVQAARQYVAALAEVTRVYDAGEMTVGDAQEICESKTDALVAACGGAVDATR